MLAAAKRSMWALAAIVASADVAAADPIMSVGGTGGVTLTSDGKNVTLVFTPVANVTTSGTLGSPRFTAPGLTMNLQSIVLPVSGLTQGAPFSGGSPAGFSLTNGAGATSWTTTSQAASEAVDPQGISHVSLTAALNLSANGAGLDLAPHFDHAFSERHGSGATTFWTPELTIDAAFTDVNLKNVLTEGGSATGSASSFASVNEGIASPPPPNSASTPEPTAWAAWLLACCIAGSARRRLWIS
jgi:hypothetical protein